jgi:hypothetical protein
VNLSKSDGLKPGGLPNWRELRLAQQRASLKDQPLGQYDHLFEPRYTKIPWGSRLTDARKKALNVGEQIWPQERFLFKQMLHHREEALSWVFSEYGRVRPEVAPPQVIRTVPHEAFQAPSFNIPRALRGQIIDMLRQRIDRGVYEPCYGPYRNPIFLVKKKTSGYRIINTVMHFNRVTIRDANLPPSADYFSEEFAGCKVASLIDFFSRYDQVELAKESRDLTGFQTELGLLRQVTLPIGGTNSPGQFQRVTTRVVERHIPDRAGVFIDDLGVKGPKIDYRGEEALPGVRRYILEHLIWLDSVLADVERSGITVAGGKSQFLMAAMIVVGYICNGEGRQPDSSKVEKIIT